jgi:ATP-dependent Zn protease
VVFANLIKIKTLIEQMHVGLGGIVSKIMFIEQTTSKMAQGFTEFIQMTEGMVDQIDDTRKFGQIYKTSDGKYSAKTLDELIDKIKNSGEESEYFSDDEISKLKNLFEQDEDDNFEEDEDDS